MVKVYSIDGITPVVHPSAYVHPSAVLIGDVIVGARAYIGPCACLRGDFGRIVIGEGANIQDTCVLHGFPGREMRVAADGHIGHGAVLHSCVIERDALVGINAVVNDNAVVGEASFVAAMSFVKADFVVPARSLAVGIPAKVLRALSKDEITWKREATRQYQALSVRSLAGMKAATALTAIEARRGRHPAGKDVVPLSEMKRRKARKA